MTPQPLPAASIAHSAAYAALSAAYAPTRNLPYGLTPVPAQPRSTWQPA
jgi:hypothetical protein